MTDIAGYRTKIRNVLGDALGTRYGDDMVDESLRWALAAYSKALPQVKVSTVVCGICSKRN